MKKKMLALLLTGTLLAMTVLGGCGKKDTQEQQEGSALSVTTDSSDTEESPDYLAPGVELPEGADSMVSVLQALMMAAYTQTDAQYYNAGDDELDRANFWESVRLLVSLETSGADDTSDSGDADESSMTLEKETVMIYATSLFGNYDCAAKGLPTLSGTSNGDVTYQSYNGTYTFAIVDTSDLQPYITSCEEDGSGAYKLQAELRTTEDDETVGEYGFMMEEISGDGAFAYAVTSCVDLTEEDTDTEDDETEATEATQTEEEDTTSGDDPDAGTDTDASSDDPDETDASPSGSTDSSDSSTGSAISQSDAQKKAQSYMEERVSDDGSSYSMAYDGTKTFDGVDYYSYSVTRKSSDGESSYVTNIYVDSATGSDVWDEAD